MEIKAFGGNTISIKVNKTRFVIDPAIDKMKIKNPKLKGAVMMMTNSYETLTEVDLHDKDVEFTITTPGEYEVHDVNIVGVDTPASLDVHDDSGDDKVYNTAYSLRSDGLAVGVLGHPATLLTESIYETLGTVDVLICPVGGGGITLDAVAAAKIVKEIDPALVIPVHYAQSGVVYEVEQAELKDFVSELGVPHRNEDKLKIKKSDLGETLEVVELKV